REDAGFHAYQMLEAGVRQSAAWGDTGEGRHILIAVARYLAAHSPTESAALQTAEIARRFGRGGGLQQDAGGAWGARAAGGGGGWPGSSAADAHHAQRLLGGLCAVSAAEFLHSRRWQDRAARRRGSCHRRSRLKSPQIPPPSVPRGSFPHRDSRAGC